MICTAIAVSIALSHHVGFADDYKEIHPNIECSTSLADINVYHNSEDNTSIAISKNIQITKNVSIDAGIVTGYSEADVFPLVKLNYEITDKLELSVAPGLERGTVGLIGILNYKIINW